MPLRQLPKFYHPDFAIPGKKPLVPVEPDWSNRFIRDRAFYLPLQEPYTTQLKAFWQELPTGTLGAPVWPQSDLTKFNTPGASYKNGWLRLNPASGGAYHSDSGIDSMAESTNPVQTWVVKVKNARYVSQGSSLNIIFGLRSIDGVLVAINSSNQLQVWHTNSSQTYTTVDLNDGKEHTIALVIDQTTLKVYDNGVKQATEIAVSSGYASSSAKIVIGGDQSATTRYCECEIAWAGAWKRAFTLQEVRAISSDPYQQLKPVTPTAYYVADAASGSYTLSADSGSYTVTGTNASLLLASILGADSGSYTYTGTNADLDRGYPLAADSGTYTYTGTAATLTFASAGNYTLTADSGAYTYTGTAAALEFGAVLSVDSGAYTYTGTNADMNRGYTLVANAGAYTYTGTNVDLPVAVRLVAESGGYTYNGTAATLDFSGQVWTVQGNATTVWTTQNDSSTTWSIQ